MNQSDLLLWHMICMTHTISKSAVWLTMVMYMSVGRLVYYNKMQGLYLSVGSNVFRSAFRLHDGRLNSGRSLRRPRCSLLRSFAGPRILRFSLLTRFSPTSRCSSRWVSIYDVHIDGDWTESNDCNTLWSRL